MSINPYKAPNAEPVPVREPGGGDGARLLVMVKSQRAMMWLVLAKLGLDFSSGIAGGVLDGLALFAFWSAFFLVGTALGYFVFRLANGVYGIGPGILCSLLSFIPCFGTLVVLVLNGNAVDQLRKMGVKVRMMGATAQQLQDLAASITAQASPHAPHEDASRGA